MSISTSTSSSIRRRSNVRASVLDEPVKESPIRRNVVLTPINANIITNSSTMSVQSSRNTERCLEEFQKTVKMVSDNRLTKKNCFHISMLTHQIINKVSKKSDDTDTFQKASSALGANTKIYALRVDTVHHDTRQYIQDMQRKGSNKDEVSDSENNTENLDATLVEDGDINNKKKPEKRIRTRKIRKKNTLVKNIDSITETNENVDDQETAIRLRRKYDFEPDTKRGISHMLCKHQPNSLIPVFSQNVPAYSSDHNLVNEEIYKCGDFSFPSKINILKDIEYFSFTKSTFDADHEKPRELRISMVNVEENFNYDMPSCYMPEEMEDDDSDHSIIEDKHSLTSCDLTTTIETYPLNDEPIDFLNVWKRRKPKTINNRKSVPNLDNNKKRQTYDVIFITNMPNFHEYLTSRYKSNAIDSSCDDLMTNRLKKTFELLERKMDISSARCSLNPNDKKASIDNNEVIPIGDEISNTVFQPDMENDLHLENCDGNNDDCDDDNDNGDINDIEPTDVRKAFSLARSGIEDDMVTPPTKLARVELQFEKKARDVNVAKLKEKMMKYLRCPAPIALVMEENVFENEKTLPKTIPKFSDLCRFLMDHDDKVKDGFTSLPYVFNALLHLSNVQEIDFTELEGGNELLLTYRENNLRTPMKV